jgi:hypothetical protein
VNRKQFLDKKKKGKNGGGRRDGGERTEMKGKFRKHDVDDTDNKCSIDGKLMYYHFHDGRWKPVDKTQEQISAAKKSAAAKEARLAASALLPAGEGGPSVADMTAATPVSTGAPAMAKLRAVNLIKLVYEQLSIYEG